MCCQRCIFSISSEACDYWVCMGSSVKHCKFLLIQIVPFCTAVNECTHFSITTPTTCVVKLLKFFYLDREKYFSVVLIYTSSVRKVEHSFTCSRAFLYYFWLVCSCLLPIYILGSSPTASVKSSSYIISPLSVICYSLSTFCLCLWCFLASYCCFIIFYVISMSLNFFIACGLN